MSENRMAASRGNRFEGLQRHFSRERGRFAQGEESSLRGAASRCIREGSACLAHQPYRRVRGRLPEERPYQRVVLQGRHRLQSFIKRRVMNFHSSALTGVMESRLPRARVRILESSRWPRNSARLTSPVLRRTATSTLNQRGDSRFASLSK